MSLPSAEQARALLRTRRTVHDFVPNSAPPVELLNQALETACWAPNHGLNQPWRFYVLGADTREDICQLNARLVAEKKGDAAGQKKLERWRQMPGWLVVTSAKDSDALVEQENYAACCCAIHNFSLALWVQGYGCKWTTGAVTRHAEFYDLLWVDPGAEQVVGLVWFGKANAVPRMHRASLASRLVTLP